MRWRKMPLVVAGLFGHQPLGAQNLYVCTGPPMPSFNGHLGSSSTISGALDLATGPRSSTERVKRGPQSDNDDRAIRLAAPPKRNRTRKAAGPFPRRAGRARRTRESVMTQRYELIGLLIILAILLLAGIAGFFLPAAGRTPELVPPSCCSAPVLAQQLP